MLAAAAPSPERFPALFHLDLEILSSEGELPEELSRHLQSVATQALAISADPTSASADTLAEAIQLALAMRSSKQLQSAVETASYKPIDSEDAKRILKVERAFETAY